MAERNASLLLSDGDQPADGLHRANVIQWYGGPLSISAFGAFDGATVEVVMAARMPANGDRELFEDEDEFPDTDFISLHSFTAPGVFSRENLNPCALLVKVASSGDDTRVRINLG